MELNRGFSLTSLISSKIISIAFWTSRPIHHTEFREVLISIKTSLVSKRTSTWHIFYFMLVQTKIPSHFFFPFHVEYIFVSFSVILFITGEAAPAALPANARWTALPLQALLHWEHLRGRMPPSDDHATPLTQSQVPNSS